METTVKPFVLLLVEDEKSDANLVEWALKENRLDVDLHHVLDGNEALCFLHRAAPRFLEAPRPDLILLDLNMPCMSGLECLAAIKQEPSLDDIPVVMLSTSYAESDVFASRDLGAADYFTKPMDIHQFTEAIRILGERWISPDAATKRKSPTSLQHTVELLEALPALPKIAHEILSIKLATDEGNDLLLKLVKKDPAILAKVIGLANSPLFGTSRAIETIASAATVLGVNRIKMVALSFAMISSMRRKPPGLLDVAHLWRHSMVTALVMDELSKAMPPERRPPEDEIYLAGLLHDIGFLVLEYVDPELSDRFHAARIGAGAGLPITELEAELLEMNHCELGALLAEHWNLPETIIAVLRDHHSEGVVPGAVGQPLIAMASLVEKLLPPFDVPEQIPSGIHPNDWLALGVPVDRIEKVEFAMRKQAKEISSISA